MKRTWHVRLIQLAPIVFLALGLVAWFAAPPGIRATALRERPQAAGPASQPQIAPSDPTVDAMQAIDAQRAPQLRPGATADPATEFRLSAEVPAGVQTDSPGLLSSAQAAWTALMADSARLYSAPRTLKANALPPNDPAFAAIDQYERTTGSRVAVAVIPGAQNPKVVMSSIVDPNVLTAAERAELTERGTMEVLRRTQRGAQASTPGNLGDAADAAAIPVGAFDEGSGGSDGERSVMTATFAADGHIYEAYQLAPAQFADGNNVGFSLWTDVVTSEHQRAIDAAARQCKGTIVVIGPIDAPPVIERLPAGMSEADAKRLIHLNLAALQSLVGYVGPFHLNPDMRKAAGGNASWGEATLVAAMNASIDSTHPAEAVFFVGVAEKNPLIGAYRERIGSGPLTSARVLIAANLQVVLGAIGALFLLSVIASPLAFAYERRHNERLDLERERERVQRQAGERVLSRLTELSTSMDAAALDAGSTHGELLGVAADIDATVAELKRILQDAPLQKGAERD